MQAYVAPAPRAAIAAAALAATAAIVAFSIVVPAKLDAAHTRSIVAPMEVVALPKRIVVGARETTVVSAQGTESAVKTGQQI